LSTFDRFFGAVRAGEEAAAGAPAGRGKCEFESPITSRSSIIPVSNFRFGVRPFAATPAE
jgi:hypothetical protein